MYVKEERYQKKIKSIKHIKGEEFFISAKVLCEASQRNPAGRTNIAKKEEKAI